jgi:NADH-quinone oxidoreductase subunit A
MPLVLSTNAMTSQPQIFVEYFSILIFLLVSILLSFVVFALSYVIASQKSDTEKVSAYECGFDPFDDARNTFDVRFYLVAILFIIFDLEVSFLFPWALTLGTLTQTVNEKLTLFFSWTQENQSAHFTDEAMHLYSTGANIRAEQVQQLVQPTQPTQHTMEFFPVFTNGIQLENTSGDLFAVWTMFVFLVILTIGFIYEWKKGALEWE